MRGTYMRKQNSLIRVLIILLLIQLGLSARLSVPIENNGDVKNR
jgi:hypothetical protein